MKIDFGPYPKGESARRMVVKVERWDDVELHSDLALIIVPLLKQFRKNCHSYPASLTAENVAGDPGMKKWKVILDKMIWSFTEIANEGEEASREPELPKRRTEAALARWRQRQDEYDARIQEGLRLFGEHYRSLWN